MTRIAERTVLFADLRGSTALFEGLGNAEATAVVTHCVGRLSEAVPAQGGRLIKTLGDGLLALFEQPDQAVACASAMHATLDELVQRGQQRGASAGLRALRVQVAMAKGEVVEMQGDCFGDAVNIAARLLDHAGDDETLITGEVLATLPEAQRRLWRSLDRIALRGRAEPVQVHVRWRSGHQGESTQMSALTQFGEVPATGEPDGLRLTWLDLTRVFAGEHMPVVLGRNPQSAFCVDDSRVSRSHARIDWHGGAFTLTDLSFNGTQVRFADGETLSLRRGNCTLHGSGSISLGGSPSDPTAASVRFEVLRFDDTQPRQTL
jgi:class 3 adenylate cyclase